MNYSQIQWETGDASSGTQGFGRSSARVGFSNGIATSYEIPRSGINGYLLDSNAARLIHTSQNNNQPGRYIYAVQNTGTSVQGKTSSALPQPRVKPHHQAPELRFFYLFDAYGGYEATT